MKFAIKNEVPYDTKKLQNNYEFDETSDLKSFGFLFISSIIHVALFLGAIYLGSLVKEPVMNFIEFTINDNGTGASLPALSNAGSKPETTAEAITDSSSAAMSEVVSTSKGESTATAIVPKLKAARPKSTQNLPNKNIAKTPIVEKTLAPVLETEEFENTIKDDLQKLSNDSRSVPVTDAFNTESIESDLEKIDQSNNQKVAHLNQELEGETADFEQEQDETLKNLARSDEQNKKLLDQKAAIAKTQRKNLEDKLASEKAAALAAQRRLQKEQQVKSRGAGNQGGTGDESTVGYIDGQKIKSLSELRQVPGNKRPQYSNSDRLARREGEVAFLAYVSKEGQISDLKLLKSTGHRSLDLQTLKSVKSWKFYPGQEGWVEIPIRWDLKGGPKEMPTLLRRQISQK